MDVLNFLFLDSVSEFFNPKKRIFIGYIVTAIVIASFWLVFIRKINFHESIQKIFDKTIFFSKSAKSDYLLFFLNQIIMSVLSPLLITQLAIATAIFYYLHSVSWLEPGILESTPIILVITFFTIFHFIIEDFSKYVVHRFMHKWPLLWALHKVHHSATCLTPMTVFRTHPLEGVIFSLRGAITQAISISLFVFFFGSNVDIATILGANIFIFAFNLAGSNLRHSHIDISYWRWLERIIISPAQHQVHHSVLTQHHDKNFGVALAIWDWMFGSLHHSEKIDKLTLGIDLNQKEETHKLYNLYLDPLKEIFFIILRGKIKIVEILKSFKFNSIGADQ